VPSWLGTDVDLLFDDTEPDGDVRARWVKSRPLTGDVSYR